MSGLLNIGLQALNVSQRALDATGQNIANVNTPGYSRQDLVLASRAQPEQGVRLVDVARITDNFATRQLWSDTATFKSTEVFEQYVSRLDDLLASEETSISAAMDLFFGALQTAVDDPASIPNRELFLAQTDATVRRFNDLDRLISQQNADINAQISAQASQLDQMLGRIAELNEKVTFATARSEPANELKDQRDELIRQVSEMVGVSIQSNGDDGAINLFIGNGQPLVVGNVASQVSVKDGDPDPDDKRLVIQISNNEIEVGGQVTSGSIGGLLQFREQVLEPAWNELGRLAIVFADTLNEVHRSGMDLDGNLGSNLFEDLSGTGVVLGDTDNQTNRSASHAVTITDPSRLQASDYSLKFNDFNQLTVVRQSDGQVFTLSDFTETPTPTAFQLSGAASSAKFDYSGVNDLSFDVVIAGHASSDGTFSVTLDQNYTDMNGVAAAISAQIPDVTVTHDGTRFVFTSAIPGAGNITVQNYGGTTAASGPTDIGVVSGTSGTAGFDANQHLTYQQNFATGQLTLNLDGFSLQLNGTEPFVKGDQFLIQPVRNGGEDLRTALTSGRQLAFASPLRVEGAADNQGAAVVDDVSVTDITDPAFTAVAGQLSPPAEIVFNADGTFSIFDVSTPSNPTPYSVGGVAQTNLSYSSGQPIRLNGFTVTLRGVPTPGDRFSIGFNTDGISDNANALKMSNLQQTATLDNASYQDIYGRLVESVGTKASVAQINVAANEAVLNSTTAVRDGISGVNLDEEAANIIRFQQTYQAASQLIAASRTLFDTLLRVTGG